MMIFPPHLESPVFGFMEIAMFTGTLSLTVLAFVSAFSKEKAVPENEVYLQESLHLHT
jgi:hypothetical protein